MLRFRQASIFSRRERRYCKRLSFALTGLREIRLRQVRFKMRPTSSPQNKVSSGQKCLPTRRRGKFSGVEVHATWSFRLKTGIQRLAQSRANKASRTKNVWDDVTFVADAATSLS